MDLTTLILIMIGSGLLGGITNYLITYDPNAETKYSCAGTILLGVCATITVPLFLQIVSNNLLDTASAKNYLIFTGFCIIAALSSKRFIANLSEKVLDMQKQLNKKGQDIKKVESKTQEVIKRVDNLAEITENLKNESHRADVKNAILIGKPVSVNNESVNLFSTSLFENKDTFRTIEEFASDSGIPVTDTDIILKHLEITGFVESKIGNGNVMRWRLLKNPIVILSANYGTEETHVDVTSRIKELVTQEIFEGSVSPPFLNVQDPVPFVSKVLKIHCRIRGEERVLEYSDGHTFYIR